MPRARRTRKTQAADSKPARRSGFLTKAEVARPLASLVFLSPLLAFYAVGLIWVRPDLAARADILLRQALEWLGVTGALAPTWLVVAILLLWHLVRRDPWRVSWGVLAEMATETALLAVPLFVIYALFQAGAGGALALGPAAMQPAVADPPPAWLDIAMTSIGAGVYEELLFRLLMVGGPIFILRHVLKDQSFGGIVAVVFMVAAIFAGAHHLDNPAGFAWPLFLYRAAAGVYLGFIFVYRGFGIATGVHIAFNLIVKAAPLWGWGV